MLNNNTCPIWGKGTLRINMLMVRRISQPSSQEMSLIHRFGTFCLKSVEWSTYYKQVNERLARFLQGEYKIALSSQLKQAYFCAADEDPVDFQFDEAVL